MSRPRTENLRALWWLWVPCVFMAAQAGLELSLPSRILSNIHSENGPHETLEFMAIFAAFVVAARTLLTPGLKDRPWLMSWVALAALCSFYVAGEEISWGQQLFHWATPDYWTQVNDQHETNLHNTSSWLDQKPKMLLEIGVFTGGLIIPLLLRFRPAWLPKRFGGIYPPAILGVTSGLALAIMLLHKIEQASPFHFFTRANEVEELYLYYFVLLYMVILRRRILQQ